MIYHFVKAKSDTAQFRCEDSYFDWLLIYTRSDESQRGERPLVFVNRWLLIFIQVIYDEYFDFPLSSYMTDCFKCNHRRPNL